MSDAATAVAAIAGTWLIWHVVGRALERAGVRAQGTRGAAALP